MCTIPTMLTIKEAVKVTGLSEHYIRQLCKQEQRIRRKAGNKYLVNLEKLVDYLNADEVSAPTCVAGIRDLSKC